MSEEKATRKVLVEKRAFVEHSAVNDDDENNVVVLERWSFWWGETLMRSVQGDHVEVFRSVTDNTRKTDELVDELVEVIKNERRKRE